MKFLQDISLDCIEYEKLLISKFLFLVLIISIVFSFSLSNDKEKVILWMIIPGILLFITNKMNLKKYINFTQLNYKFPLESIIIFFIVWMNKDSNNWIGLNSSSSCCYILWINCSDLRAVIISLFTIILNKEDNSNLILINFYRFSALFIFDFHFS